LSTVFGEHEVGGTNVLYISPVDLDVLSLGNRLGERPMPSLTHMAMNSVPPAFVGMGALMGSLWWVIERRRKIQAQTAASSSAMNTVPTGRERIDEDPKVIP